MSVLTVKELIKQLKKMPQDAEVWFQDHDQSSHEHDGPVDCVFLWRKDEEEAELRKRGMPGELTEIADKPNIIVTLK